MAETTRAHEPLDTTAEVETPEHVRFRYQMAGPARRAVAYVIDLLARGAILFVFVLVAGVAGVAAGDAISHASSGVILIVWFLLEWFYYVFWEMIWGGTTPGKRALRLRVVTEGGYPLGFFGSFLRNLLRAADFLPAGYAIGGLVAGCDRRFRRLGDLVAGTMVIVEERHAVADPLHIEPPPTDKELSRLPQRVPLSGDELEAVELFLRRRSRLSPAREIELAEMVALNFARRMGLKTRDAPRLLALVHHRAHQKGGMISQDEFVAARKRDWSELDRLLGQGVALSSLDGPTISRMAGLYRALCTDLMRCRAARYTPDLAGYLDGLAARAHSSLYGSEPLRTPNLLRFFTHDFPATLRKNWRFFAVACALFYIPFFIGMAGAIGSPDLATQILPAPMLEGMRQMYSEGFNSGRSEGTDMGMTGFYVYNNVGIAFRCFATGVLFCAGSLFSLVYNGLVMGTVLGYVIAGGHGRNILTFVMGHGSFELTAIVIAGAAGLQMGYALVDTGGRTRIGSLRKQAPDIARLVVGAAVMLGIAALIEGFWSPSSVAPPVKWVVAGALWLGIALYFALVGRGGGRPAS